MLAIPIAALAAWACQTAPAASPTADLGEANIRTSFRADGRFCYLYLGVSEGFFSQEGLRVRIDEGENSVQAIQTVGSGQDFMSEPSINLLPIALAQGAPVRAVTALDQQHPAGVIVHGDSDIQSAAELGGTQILVGPGDALTLLDPFLEANGVDTTTVEIVNTDHPTKLQSFLASQGDGATIFSEGELPVILKQDPAARFYPYSDVLSMYGLGLVVSEESIEQRPDAVRAAVAGVVAAERAALDDPEECIDALVAAFPDRTFDRDIALGQLTEHQKLLTANGEANIGTMADDRWTALEDLLVEYFGLEQTAPSPATYYTNEFLPDE